MSVSTAGALGSGHRVEPSIPDNDRFPTISGDGRFVTLGSSATDMVAGDTNGAPAVFLPDRQTAQRRA